MSGGPIITLGASGEIVQVGVTSWAEDGESDRDFLNNLFLLAAVVVSPALDQKMSN